MTLFETVGEARRFLFGMTLFLAGIALYVVSLAGGRSHVLDTFWFYATGLLVALIGQGIASVPVQKAFTAHHKSEAMAGARFPGLRASGRAMADFYSRAGFREALRVARLGKTKPPA